MRVQEAKSSEIVILLLVSLMSLAANLPDQMVGNVLDKKLLLLVLTASVVITLFRYLHLMLFLAIVILAIGANLPQEFAEDMGISPLIMLGVLAVLVTVSLLNYAFRLLPTGAQEVAAASAGTRFQLLTAIAKGDQATVHALLGMNVRVNFFEQGFTPLHLAVEKGYPDIVRMLVNSGADLDARNTEGKTPVEVALDKKFIRSSEILFKAANSQLA